MSFIKSLESHLLETLKSKFSNLLISFLLNKISMEDFFLPINFLKFFSYGIGVKPHAFLKKYVANS